MTKQNLQDLTREDWNRLFPLELVNHNPEWERLFEKEKKWILDHVDNSYLLRIEHFGSTAIPGIMSKPYIDLIIEIPRESLFDQELIAQFEKIGYTHFEVPEREGIDAYSSFGKGYRLDGLKEQIFHIHMCPANNYMWRQIAFRDYLIKSPKRAQEYEELKLKLISRYSNDRGAYVNGKSGFVFETLEMIEREIA